MKKWQCQVCNYVHAGDELPETCPVCGIHQGQFKLIGDESGDAEADSEEKAGTVPEAEKSFKCSVCGYTHRESTPSAKCPVCGADGDSFNTVSPPSVDEVSATVEPVSAEKRWKCSVCGYIHTGPTPPDKCPVCGADRSLFALLPSEETESDQRPASQDAAKTPMTGSLPSGEGAPERAAKTPEPSAQPSALSRNYALLTNLIARLHGHPISVHIPNGVLPVAFLFLLAGIVFDSDNLLLVSHYNLVFILLAMPLVLFSGYNDWQLRLGGNMTTVIKVKMICGVTVTALSFALVVWRWINPDVLEPWSSGRWVYFSAFAAALAAAGVAGFNGGKLIQFPGEDRLK